MYNCLRRRFIEPFPLVQLQTSLVSSIIGHVQRFVVDTISSERRREQTEIPTPTVSNVLTTVEKEVTHLSNLSPQSTVVKIMSELRPVLIEIIKNEVDA